MYCHDCENYFGEASCRVKGLTGYLRKADELPCFKPKQPKNNKEMKERTKKCRTCGKVLPLDSFDGDARSKDGLAKDCKSCKDERFHLIHGFEMVPQPEEKKAEAAKPKAEPVADFIPEPAPKPKPQSKEDPTLLENPKIQEAIKQKTFYDFTWEVKSYPDLVFALKQAGFTGTLTKTSDSYEITLTIK